MLRLLRPALFSALLVGLMVCSASPVVAVDSFFDVFSKMPDPGIRESPTLGVMYPQGIGLRNLQLTHPTNRIPEPPPGGSQTVNSFFDVFTELSLDGGQTWLPRTAGAQEAERASDAGGSGDTRFFDTEMLALDIAGGSLPGGVMIRESPTRASLGRRTAQTVPGGYAIDSFFDVFTELSTDGGQNWAPGNSSLHMIGTPEPATLTMLGAGALLVLFYAWRRKRAA
jgi:hypothetical protein